MGRAVGLLVVGVGLVATGLWFAWFKPLRQWRSGNGQWVWARVVRVLPAGHTTMPPYNAWPPRVVLHYVVDGVPREGTLWLDDTKPGDYRSDQVLRVFVYGRRGTRLRTEAETNFEANAIRLTPTILGLVAIALGILNLVHRP